MKDLKDFVLPDTLASTNVRHVQVEKFSQANLDWSDSVIHDQYALVRFLELTRI